jgi:hypothetical protein
MSVTVAAAVPPILDRHADAWFSMIADFERVHLPF